MTHWSLTSHCVLFKREELLCSGEPSHSMCVLLAVQVGAEKLGFPFSGWGAAAAQRNCDFYMWYLLLSPPHFGKLWGFLFSDNRGKQKVFPSRQFDQIFVLDSPKAFESVWYPASSWLQWNAPFWFPRNMSNVPPSLFFLYFFPSPFFSFTLSSYIYTLLTSASQEM